MPLLAHAAGQVGDPQVRHRGTIGGSIAHGDPASDLPAVLLALGGDDGRPGPGRRAGRSPADDFFTGFLESALAPDELLTEIRVPKVGRRRLVVPEVQPPGPGLGHRRRGRGRTTARPGVGLVNMGSTPVFAQAVVDAVAGGASAADAAEQAADEAEPQADLNASVEFRGHLAQVLVRRALEEAGA